MKNSFPLNVQNSVDAISNIPAVTNILEVICHTTKMGFAAVARVTDDKWVACAVRDEIQFGLIPGSELALETTICNEIRQTHQEVVIDHVSENKLYAQHHTPLMYGFQSYISIPIILKDGSFFGTLCAIDPKPAHLENSGTIKIFRLFADMIAFHLNAIHTVEQLAISQTHLLEERETAELREQFIAILGHDLRNPVGAISNAAEILLLKPTEETTLRLANMIKNSSYRIKVMISNMLDFARGRLGEGLVLNYTTKKSLEATLNDVLHELNVISPERLVETKYSISDTVSFDSIRIAQLFSNLLGNAFTYAKEGTPIVVEATTNNGEFKLSVCNKSDKIPDAVMNRLFQPFYRGGAAQKHEGLGLGLYIGAEIARAHGGTLTLTSTDIETCFTLVMPVKQPE